MRFTHKPLNLIGPHNTALRSSARLRLAVALQLLWAPGHGTDVARPTPRAPHLRDTPLRRRALRCRCEGPAKKKSTDPPVHLLNLRPTHPPPDFFFLTFFFSAFLGVSRQGEFKNTTNIFLQKVHVEKNKNRQKFRCHFVPLSC
jgi:hypothetical protein